MIYLDNAATTLPKPLSVERAVCRAMQSMASPGRGAHPPAIRAAETLFQCRCAAAELFHVSEPERVVFTMNATHGLNIAIRSKARRGTRVLISGFEHNSVTRPLAELGAEIRVAGRRLFDRENTLREFGREIPGAELVDNPSEKKYPMPLFCQRKVKCEVGRIRKDIMFDNGLSFWVAGDQLWKGAALNAVQIAELL